MIVIVDKDYISEVMELQIIKDIMVMERIIMNLEIALEVLRW